MGTYYLGIDDARNVASMVKEILAWEGSRGRVPEEAIKQYEIIHGQPGRRDRPRADDRFSHD